VGSIKASRDKAARPLTSALAKRKRMELPRSEQHIIDAYDIQRDVFRLINLSYGFGALLEGSEGDVQCRSDSALFKKYKDFFEKEATTLLLKIAINCRVLDDQLKKSETQINPEDFVNEEILGDILLERNGVEQFPALTLRECFNKIIHATYIEHDIRPGEPDDWKPYYMPEVHLLGSFGKTEWSVAIYLMPFCRVVFDFLEAYLANLAASVDGAKTARHT
jgi:hypothetical protein